MATMTITIATADVTRVVTAICGVFGYQATIVPPVGSPFPNPETPNQFAQRMLIVTAKSWVKTWEAQQAAIAAAATAGTNADGVGIS